MRTIAEKMGIKKDTRAFLMKAPSNLLETIGSPTINTASELAGKFDYIHLFAKTQTELDRQLPKLKAHLQPRGMLWVSWPKKGLLNTDFKLTNVITIGYRHGLVESKTISIDATWSAIKFTYPKKGKAYSNSYGKLPD